MSVSEPHRRELHAAVTARDGQRLLAVARSIADAAKPPTRRVTASPFMTTEIGAAMLAGVGPKWAAQLRKKLYTYVGRDSEVQVASLNAENMTVHGEDKLFEIRILAGDWSPIPPAKGKPSPWQRPVLRRQRKVLDAFSRRDPKALGTAIGAIARADPAKWSLLAYAMYRFVRDKGIDVKVPRKYDF